MITFRNAVEQDRGQLCRDCTKRIKLGEPVLVIKLGNDAPYTYRWVFVHVACLRPKMKEFAQQTFEKMRHEMWLRVPETVRKGESLTALSS